MTAAKRGVKIVQGQPGTFLNFGHKPFRLHIALGQIDSAPVSKGVVLHPGSRVYSQGVISKKLMDSVATSARLLLTWRAGYMGHQKRPG